MSVQSRSTRPLRAILAVLLACLILVIFWAGMALAQAPVDSQSSAVVYDPAIAGILSQVTTPTLVYELGGLTGERPVTVAGISYTISTRNSYQSQAISMATRYAYEQLTAAGLDVTYHDYVYGSDHWRNVAAEKRGVVYPDEVYLITAHLDDMPDGLLAPGADDNGSGSVAVLLAARLLADRRFAYTVRFVLFTGEEQGLRGSAAYAADCAARGETIRGVINLDMIAFNSDEKPLPAVDLHASNSVPESLVLTRAFSDVIGVYGLDLLPDRFVDNGLLRRSDQWSFLAWGYPAMMAIEDNDDFNTHYHTASDTLSTLDLDYYADFTRAAIATLAHLSEMFPDVGWGHVSGAVSDLETGQPLSGALVSASAPGYAAYTFTAVTDWGGIYTLTLPAAAYTLTGWMALPPYYSATVTGVVAVTDTVVAQDFALEPWLRLYLPLIAHGD